MASIGDVEGGGGDAIETGGVLEDKEEDIGLIPSIRFKASSSEELEGGRKSFDNKGGKRLGRKSATEVLGNEVIVEEGADPPPFKIFKSPCFLSKT